MRVQARTHRSITDLVTESLDRSCDELLSESAPPCERIESSGLI
jgi:hypothetical protein